MLVCEAVLKKKRLKKKEKVVLKASSLLQSAKQQRAFWDKTNHVVVHRISCTYRRNAI